jgi:hypothetical protein
MSDGQAGVEAVVILGYDKLDFVAERLVAGRGN